MMAVSQTYKILWGTGLFFVILPHLNLGLLSDYKICGDSECESKMSRVQATKDHHGKDCRFLNFKRGDTIFVYHKLTGKREDLWAGSIDKQFGYFPKDAVQEEEVYAAMEKVVETREFDFFCMDEFGHIIDSSHLDSDDEYDVDEKIQNTESETTQTPPHTHDTNMESPSTSADVPTEPLASAQEADGTSTEEDENKNAGDAAAGTHQEAQESPNKQGGSAPSPWLGSSVTGWLGLSEGEEPGNLAEGEKKDEKKETWWQGLGGQGKPDDATEGREEEDGERADSFTSSMTGWLGFGGEKKNDQPAEKDEERENDKEQEPAETFRSRRMSLDLEGSQLHEDEKEETGTLGWLGNGLSNTLGFGWTSQESEREAEETIQGEKEEPASNSWFDMGVRDMLGYGKDKSEVDESTGSGFKETEEQSIGSSGTEEEKNEPASDEPDESDQSDSLARTEEETHQSELGQEGEGHPVEDSSAEFGSSHSTDTATEIMSENASEENRTMFSMSESKTQMEEDADQDSSQQSDGDAHMLKGTEKDTVTGEVEQSKEEEETIQGEKEQPASNSWFDMGVRDMLGYGKDKSEVDESTGRGYKETEEQPIVSDDVDTSQSQPEDQSVPSETETVPNSNNRDTSDGSKDSVLPEDAEKDASPQVDSEEKSQAAGLMSSELNIFFQTDSEEENEDDSLDDKLKEANALNGERSAEMEGKDNQTPESTENVDEDNIGEPGEEDMKTTRDQGFLTQSDINLKPDFSSGQSVGEVEEDKTEEMVEKKAEILNPDNTEESTDTSAKIGGDDHEGEGNNIETHHRDIFTAHTDGGTSGTEEEKNEPASDESDKSDSLALTEEETQSELGQEGEGHPVEGSSAEFGSSHSTDTATEILSENASEENRTMFSTSESKTQMEEDANRDSSQQSDGDAHMPKGTEKDTETEESKEEERQGGTDELKEKQEKLSEVEEIKTLEKQHEVDEEKQEVEDLKEEGKHEECEKLGGKIEELKKEEAEELMEMRKQEEVEEIKEEDNQEQLKEDEKQGEEEELKEEEKKDEMTEIKEKQDEVGELNGDEKQEVVEELKKEEKLQQIEESNDEKQKDEEELKQQEEKRVEEFKEVEEMKGKEKEDEENQVQLSDFEAEMENSLHSSPHQQKDIDRPESDSDEKETQGEIGLEMSTQAEQIETETPQMEEEKKREENKKQEEVEEEGKPKCSNELCPHSSEDGFVRDRDDSVDRLNSIDDSMTDSDQISADGTGVSQTIQFQSMEKDEDRKREEEKRNDEGIEEQGEKKNSESDINIIEDVKSNSANSISDLNALGVHQISDNDLLYSGESGQNSHPDHKLVDQTAESKGDDELYSSEAKNTDFSDHDFLLEDSKTSSYGISAEQIHSEDKINTEEDTDMEKREINVKPDDVRVNENDGNVAEIRAEGETESSVSSSDPVMSEEAAPQESQHPAGSSLLSDGDNKGGEAENRGGAFGLFKNAFSYFNQKPAAESTESAPSLDSNADETSEAQTTLTPDSTADSTQVYVQDLHTDAPTTQSQEQLEPSSPSFIQTSSPHSTQTHSHPSSLSPNTKTLFKHYKNLLAHMSPDEMTILTELFGRHKLQFLDYILGSSETMNDNPDHDESILSDIERLLHHHRETLVAPSVRLVDAPQEDKDRTRTLIALQKLEMLLTRVKETFNTRKSDTTNTSHQGLDNITPRDEWLGVYEDNDGQLDGDMGKEGVPEDEKRSEEEKLSLDLPQPLEGPGIMRQSLDFVHQIAEDSATHILAVRELLIWLTVQVVSSLPDDIRPGPDLYGVPWEPVIITGLLGLMTMLLFTCRCYSSVKSRMYRSKERWMAEQIAQLLDEKCKVLETLSKCQQEHDDLETSLRDSGVLAQTQKTENLEGKARQLGHVKRELERDLEQLKDQLEQQRDHRLEQERRIAVLEENMKTFEEETKDLQSQDEQAQTTLKVYNMNSDRLQRNLETAGEENTLLQESNAQLRQQVEGWAERVSELEAEMSRYEVAYSGMLQDVTNKDERIMSLTDRLLRMRAWDSDLEEEEREEGGEKETSNGRAGRGEENGGGDKDDTQNHLQKVQKLIYAAKLNADLKSVDEDKDRAFAKLNDEIKAKEDLQESIKEMESEKLSMQSDTENYSEQVQRLQQKLQIMTEMYQENELKLHRMLTVEEKERLQKEEKLNKADKNIALAMEELNNYRQRAEEMEEELEKTKQSYQTQISAHEKKAHNNWLAARAADRDLADTRRENGLLRQKLTDTQFKLDTIDKDPYALDSLARPLPFRAERSPYGPSPLGRPASETRAFLSPPTLMDGPPARLSPRVPRGPGEPPGGQGEMMERSGGPHSDSGSISPTWERDRRGPPPGPPGPLGPPGYMFPEPGGPMYRRPPPHPGAMGFLPPPGPHPPGPLHPRGVPLGPPHPADMADGPYRENSLGPGELEHRESGPGDRRTPPEADPRMGGPPPPGPMMGPMDGPFPRRAPYGPPPPEFYHPRGPGGPPMMHMWAPPPPGVMFPPRFPPGGPPLPPPSHPHHGPHMRPPLPDGLPPPSMGPVPSHQSPPHSQSPEQQTTSPEDAI